MNIKHIATLPTIGVVYHRVFRIVGGPHNGLLVAVKKTEITETAVFTTKEPPSWAHEDDQTTTPVLKAPPSLRELLGVMTAPFN